MSCGRSRALPGCTVQGALNGMGPLPEMPTALDIALRVFVSQAAPPLVPAGTPQGMTGQVHMPAAAPHPVLPLSVSASAPPPHAPMGALNSSMMGQAHMPPPMGQGLPQFMPPPAAPFVPNGTLHGMTGQVQMPAAFNPVLPLPVLAATSPSASMDVVDGMMGQAHMPAPANQAHLRAFIDLTTDDASPPPSHRPSYHMGNPSPLRQCHMPSAAIDDDQAVPAGATVERRLLTNSRPPPRFRQNRVRQPRVAASPYTRPQQPPATPAPSGTMRPGELPAVRRTDSVLGLCLAEAQTERERRAATAYMSNDSSLPAPVDAAPAEIGVEGVSTDAPTDVEEEWQSDRNPLSPIRAANAAMDAEAEARRAAEYVDGWRPVEYLGARPPRRWS